MNFVPCLLWVKRGVSKHIPDKVQLTQEELKNLAIGTAEELSENAKDMVEENESAMVTAGNDEMKSIDDEYHLDSYDDDDCEKTEEQKCAPIFKPEDLDVAFDDPYKVSPEDEWEDDDEKEDFLIKENDNLLVVGHVENDNSTLEVYVYNEEAGDLYVHHDIILPAYPVALEWLNFNKSNSQGSYVAVGDMTPVINIWDLDVVDMLEPTSTLGVGSESQNRSADVHHDAVLSLGWNKDSRNILASGSADEKLCLWDLESGNTVTTFNFQKGKVQSLQWHPQEPQYLLSGTTDGFIILGDCRAPVSSFTFFTVDGEVERVLWNHFQPFFFLCSTDKGKVYCMDIRTRSECYNFVAHEKTVTGLSLSCGCPGCLITSSTDKIVKVWDISSEPKFIASQKLKIGSIFAASLCPDSPFIFACGGDKSSNNIVIKNISDFPDCEVFARRLLQNPQ